MHSARRILLSVALCAYLCACTSEQTEGDFMYLRNKGADMPIRVLGNTRSGVMLVWLTGGPGDLTVLDLGEATSRIERHYGMTFWDQRGSGSAQGNAAAETFTLDQFVEDTDKVIDLIQNRYAPRKLFLIGHSWGVTLGVAYLLDARHRAKVAGFVDVDGNHDVPLLYGMKLDWLRDYAKDQVAAGKDAGYWSTVERWCDTDPPLSRANLNKLEDYRSRSNALFHDPKHDFDVSFDRIFLSPDSAPAYLFVNAANVDDNLYDSDDVLRQMSFSDRMHVITMPVAILWGKYDGIVPLPAAQAAYDSFGTPAADKRIATFEHSAHFPFLEEPVAFAEAVVAFVEDSR
jgi:pimeloyl-ACP methyl ester carboxylesterase